jgi:hypothetical protein
MKRFCTLALPALVCAAMAAPEWRVHRFEEGRFSVMLPEAPAKSRQNLRAAEKATNNAFSLRTEKGSFMVSYVDSDTFDDNRAKIAEILDSTCRGAAANAGARNFATNEIVRNGFSGRTVRFKGQDGSAYRGLVFLAGTRLYQVYAHGDAKWVDGKDVDRYLNSFKMWR